MTRDCPLLCYSLCLLKPHWSPVKWVALGQDTLWRLFENSRNDQLARWVNTAEESVVAGEKEVYNTFVVRHCLYHISPTL